MPPRPQGPITRHRGVLGDWGARWGAASVALLGAACVVACASPTLPLPPPESPMQTDGVDAEHITLTAGCGGAEGGALIVIINQNEPPDRAVGGSEANNCGAWDASVLAKSGDTLSISQQAGTLTSTSTTYLVR